MTDRVTIIEDCPGRQQRDYGPDVWEGTIGFEKLNGMAEWEANPNMPVAIIRQWVQRITGFVDAGDPRDSEWYVPRLTHLAPLSREPHVWSYRAERPWND